MRGGHESLLVGINRSVGMRPAQYGSFVLESGMVPSANRATVQVKLRASESTAVDAGDFAARWRAEAATATGAESLAISPELLDMGAPILIELFHPEPARLGPISAAVVEGLRDLQGVYDMESEPLGQVADMSLDTSAPSIHRKDERRIVTVSADVDTNLVTGPQPARLWRSRYCRNCSQPIRGSPMPSEGNSRNGARSWRRWQAASSSRCC